MMYSNKIFISSGFYYTVFRRENRIILAPCKELKKAQRYFLNAIKKVYASGSNFGYTVDVEPEDFSGMTAEEKKEYLSYNPINSTMRIDNTEQTWLSIPQYIISNDVGETGFSKVCGDERQCEYCLVYMDSIGKD